MKNVNRQGLIITALFVGLVVASFFFAPTETEIPYDLDSSGPQGLAVLRLWLDDLGYDVRRTGQGGFDLGNGADKADLLFVFPNVQTYSDEEGADLRAWVEAGGTLVLAGVRGREVALLDEFGVSEASQGFFERTDVPQQPILPDAKEMYERRSGSEYLETEDAPAAVPIFAFEESPTATSPATPSTDAADADPTDEDEESVETEEQQTRRRPTVAAQKFGEGTVWHISPRHEPINLFLREPEVARLVIAFLRTVPADGTILFDTYHLFGADQSADGEISSVREWLYQSALGRAVIFAALLTLLFLFVQGRRLGPPLPSTTDPKRREAAEYVEAMAGLHRRSNQRDAVAVHHKQRLKIALGKPLHIDPELDDATFVERLQRADHRLSPDELAATTHLIHHLANKPSEDALVDHVANVDNIIKNF